MIDGFTLGAYVLTPQIAREDADEEARWYRLLGEIPGASGVEIPFTSSLHPGGPTRLARLLPDHWHVVASMLTRSIVRAGAEPHYGLASQDAEGRAAAVADVRCLFEEVHQLQDQLGYAAVRAVELPSAPRASAPVRVSGDAFADSLLEIGEWKWGDVELVVEHCDALGAQYAPQKGYLTLSAETSAVAAARARSLSKFGQSINWGRSVLEGRSVETPLEHLQALVEGETLAGLFFSGAPGSEGALGAAWTDLHNALDTEDPSSLLTVREVRRTVDVIRWTSLDRLTFLGLKVTNPSATQDLHERLEPLRALSEAVREAVGPELMAM